MKRDKTAFIIDRIRKLKITFLFIQIYENEWKEGEKMHWKKEIEEKSALLSKIKISSSFCARNWFVVFCERL